MGEGIRMGERETPLRLSPFRMLRMLDACRLPGSRIGESLHCHPHDQLPYITFGFLHSDDRGIFITLSMSFIDYFQR